MEYFLLILLLLALIGLSSFINHLLPYIPVPLVQIALGVMLASLPIGIHVPMDPELFFVLFIAPLLFHDGKNVSRQALWKLRKQILLLALGLVFVTVFCIGYLIHWLVPSIPLSAAFALAAILSPTDVVAVSAISSRVKIPGTILHVLEGEGLMNDASGLVAFKFAVTATLTGAFSLAEASFSFIVIAIGGMLGGALLATIIIRLKVFIRRLGMEDVTIHMLIQLLTPFVIFYIIEHFHLSGVLSVVTAGIVHSIYLDRDASPAMQLQVVSQSTWTVLIYILNGLVFVLLGLQIPSVTSEIYRDSIFNNWEVTKYIFIITTSLLLVRFIWIATTRRLGWLTKDQQKIPSLRAVGILTISGVRGAVTLAGAFTIPFTMTGGIAFPERSLIIFLAAGVILVTLITASVCLPILSRTEKGNTDKLKEEMESFALLVTIDSAIRSIQELINDDNRGAAVSVITSYNHLRSRLNTGLDAERKKQESKVRLKALDAEEYFIEKIRGNGQADRETLLLAEEHIQRMRLAVTNRLQYRSWFIGTLLKRSLYALSRFFVPKNEEHLKNQHAKRKKIIRLKVNMAKAAIHYLRDHMTHENEQIYLGIIGEYNDLIMRFKLARKGADSAEYFKILRELQIKAFQAERDEIQNLYEEGDITTDVIRKIRQQINIREAYWMEASSVQSH